MTTSKTLTLLFFVGFNLFFYTTSTAQISNAKTSKNEKVNSSLPLYEKYIDDNQDAHLKEFVELISIPSISSLPSNKPEVEKAANWIVNKLKSIGVTTAQLYHAHEFRGEALGDEAGEELGRGGGRLRHLHEDAIARRERADEGADREVHGIIPRHHDPHDAQGLVMDARAARQEPEVGAPALRAHPAGEVAARMCDGLEGREEFKELRLFARAPPEVARDRVGEGRGLIEQQSLEGAEGFAARRQARCGTPGGSALLGLESGPQAGGFVV